MMKTQKLDKDLMKKNNMKLVLACINEADEISKAQIAEKVQMSIMSINRITDDLIQLGFVCETDRTKENSIGRPPMMLSLNRDNLLSLSVSLEKDTMRVGLVDPFGEIKAIREYTITSSRFDPQEVLKQLAMNLQRFIDSQPDRKILPVVGIVLPGIVDNKKGRMEFSSNLKWHNVQISKILKEYFPSKDFVVENDIKAIAIAENRFGASKQCHNSVVMNIGNGIGAAVIIDNEIYRGKNNMAGEIGHIIINPVGQMCECGQIGCLQTKIAEWAILREAQSVEADITLEGLFAHYEEKADWAVKLIDSVVDYISISINLLANTYSPEMILLCGSMIQQNKKLRELIEKNYRRHLNDYIKNSFQLKFESFGRDGHIIGGSIIAYQRYIDEVIK